MSQRNKDGFSYQMRVATRDIHKLSDQLVNAKLAFALNNNKVWADGLLVFYEIFKFLENHVSKEILPTEFYRTAAFEKDLEFYLGSEWKTKYVPRPEVVKYLTHLKEVESNNPTILLAYVYHLYMGLLSGGQILQKKRAMFRKLNLFDNSSDKEGMNVSSFSDRSIGELKDKMRNLVDQYAEMLDENTKTLLIEESTKVFELNNEIIRSVEGVNKASVHRLVLLFLVCFSIYVLYKCIF